MLAAPPEVNELTRQLIDGGAIPEEVAADAAHIAMAAVHGIDFLVTWNLHHIANDVSRHRVQTICLRTPLYCAT